MPCSATFSHPPVKCRYENKLAAANAEVAAARDALTRAVEEAKASARTQRDRALNEARKSFDKELAQANAAARQKLAEALRKAQAEQAATKDAAATEVARMKAKMIAMQDDHRTSTAALLDKVSPYACGHLQWVCVTCCTGFHRRHVISKN